MGYIKTVIKKGQLKEVLDNCLESSYLKNDIIENAFPSKKLAINSPAFYLTKNGRIRKYPKQFDILKIEPGAQCSKNFMLDKKINSLLEFVTVLKRDKVIFWKHRLSNTGFIQNLPFRACMRHIEMGQLWTVKKIETDTK